MNHQEIVGTLNQLIEAAKDGEHGLEACAERATGPELRAMLGAGAEECRRAADELQMLVREHGGFAQDHGTAAAAVQRGWQALKGRLGTITELDVLEEGERAAQRTNEGYRAALANTLPMILRVVVERQHEALKRQHAMLRALLERVSQQQRAKDDSQPSAPIPPGV